jgi:hypothetical protein
MSRNKSLPVLFMAFGVAILSIADAGAERYACVASEHGIEARVDLRTPPKDRVPTGRVAMINGKEISLGEGLKLEVPSDLTQGPDQGVDTKVTTWAGPGISVLVDQGPFVDPLASYTDRPGYRSSQETIDGRPARVVSYLDSEQSHVVAAHFAGSRTGPRDQEPLTIVIRLDPSGPGEDVALAILRSLKFVGQ